MSALTWESAPSARCYRRTPSNPPWCSWCTRPCPWRRRRAGPWGSSGPAEWRTSAAQKELRKRGRGTKTATKENQSLKAQITLWQYSSHLYSHSNAHLPDFSSSGLIKHWWKPSLLTSFLFLLSYGAKYQRGINCGRECEVVAQGLLICSCVTMGKPLKCCLRWAVTSSLRVNITLCCSPACPAADKRPRRYTQISSCYFSWDSCSLSHFGDVQHNGTQRDIFSPNHYHFPLLQLKSAAVDCGRKTLLTLHATEWMKANKEAPFSFSFR